MMLDIKESQNLCDWLLERGLGLSECACVISHIECGDPFSLALLKVFIERKKMMEKIDENDAFNPWHDPIIP